MRIFITEIRAIDPSDGELKSWEGPRIMAPTWYLAEQWVSQHMGYATVGGMLESDIPCDENYNPQWQNAIDYSKINLN